MIEVQGITKRYGAFVAVRDLSFSVGKGRVLGFIGPNGAGKTFPYREAQISDRHEGPVALGDPLDLVGSLSKGYRQRVGLAQALLHQPPVLILDEPTSGLDPAQMVGVRQLISDLRHDHTVVLSTHILREVEALCDDVVVINKGALAAKGTLDEVRLAHAPVRYRVGLPGVDLDKAANAVGALDLVGQVRLIDGGLEVSAPQDPRVAIAACVVNAGWALESLERIAPSLEDAFLSLVGAEGELL